jgi:hypothetical protein
MFEASAPVMKGPVQNILFDVFEARRADRKSAVSFLPFEYFIELAVNPFWRVRLDVADKIIEAVRCFKGRPADVLRAGQQTNVIIDAADRHRHALEIFYDAAEISVESFSKVIRDQRKTRFSGKNNVKMQAGVGG